jgi:hypothetical protein
VRIDVGRLRGRRGAAVVCIGKRQAENATSHQTRVENGFDDPKAVLIMVYKQSRWSAWALSPRLAAVLAIADGLLPGTQ